MEQSDSDKLEPPSLDGVFARKRREKQEREASPRWAEPYAAPTPAPPEPEPIPTPTPLPTPNPIPDPIPAPSPLPTPDPIPDPALEAEPPAELEAEASTTEPVPPGPNTLVATPETTREHRPAVNETAVLARVTEDAQVSAPPPRQKAPKAPAAEKAPKTKTPRPAKTPKAPKEPKAKKAARTHHFPAVIATIIAGACSGGTLVGLVAVFNRWGGQTDSMNAVELLGAFVAAIVVGFILLAIGRIGHRAAIAFLGVGLVAVVLMFFPSDRWQTGTGSIVVVVATAVAYLGAHMIAREATSEN